MRVGVPTRRIIASKHCRCKRISSARQKHIWKESWWNGFDCLKLVRNIHQSKFTRRILQTRFAVGISSWFPESVFKRSFSWFLGVERQLWNVARTGGIGIDRAESTLLRYSISTDSCWAPRSEMYWIPRNCSM